MIRRLMSDMLQMLSLAAYLFKGLAFMRDGIEMRKAKSLSRGAQAPLSKKDIHIQRGSVATCARR